ncbi:MAG: methionyl-tRNA formyltransferase [Ilumatobacteraceae bacterium]
MNLVYLGSPEMAVAPLEALVAAGHDVRLVVTGRDKRRGRGGATSPTPVKAAALGLGLVVSHDLDDAVGVGADLGVVVAFGRLVPVGILERLPMINLHFSLLPRWRGAAPVERAILAGDGTTGVCVMEVAEGLDTGGVFAREEVPIESTTTADELRRTLVRVGSALLVDTLDRGLGHPAPQVGESTYAAKLTVADRRIDWSAPAEQIGRVVRIGGAWTTFRGARVKIHDMVIDDGSVVPTVVQPEGRSSMPYDEWLRGVRPAPGEWFE